MLSIQKILTSLNAFDPLITRLKDRLTILSEKRSNVGIVIFDTVEPSAAGSAPTAIVAYSEDSYPYITLLSAYIVPISGEFSLASLTNIMEERIYEMEGLLFKSTLTLVFCFSITNNDDCKVHIRYTT